MEDPKSKINISVANADKPIIVHVLEGQAPNPINPVKRGVISGGIRAVSELLYCDEINKTIDRKNAVITCNHAKGKIEFCSDPSSEICWRVIGTLNPNPELQSLGINSKSEFYITDLRSRLKFAGPLFAERDQHASLMKKLESIKIRFNKEITDENDSLGNSNKASTIKTDIDNGLTEGFMLYCPLYDGEEAVKFKVEILFSADGNKLTCWLESTEMNELHQSQMEKIMDRESKNFDGFAVINQYS